MKPYLQFPRYEKDTKDQRCANGPFRWANIKTDEQGEFHLPERCVPFAKHIAPKQNTPIRVCFALEMLPGIEFTI